MKVQLKTWNTIKKCEQIYSKVSDYITSIVNEKDAGRVYDVITVDNDDKFNTYRIKLDAGNLWIPNYVIKKVIYDN